MTSLISASLWTSFRQIYRLNSSWSDIWNISYIKLRIWNQVSYDHRSYERNVIKQLRIEARKSQDFNGVWTRDLAIPVRRSN